ncbi:MAG: sodium/glutamate symporter [Oligoflexia bacterium]
MAFGLVETLALAALGLLVGQGLVRSIPVLHRLCLPEPVLGGLVLAALWSGLEAGWGVSLSFDLSLQTPLMIAFFLSVGWLASLKSLRVGGPEVFKFLLLCSVVLVLQNLIGIGLARAMGAHPLLGVLSGSVSLAGGPGTALAFAPLFEKAGVEDAGSIGTACALAGIILGGLLGTPLSTHLIGLKGVKKNSLGVAPQIQKTGSSELPSGPEIVRSEASLLAHLKFFLIVMALGSVLGRWIQDRGITLPIYIGSMLVAASARNFLDFSIQRRHRLGRALPGRVLSGQLIDELGSISLAYFLVVATMTLQFKQLAALAGLLVVILAVQTALAIGVARFVVFRFFGRDYDAAVMAGGFMGFMLGTTANAVANMNALSNRYSERLGVPARAFLVVPLVGACFIDFVNALVITFLVRAF